MSERIKVLGISGSLHKASSNTGLLRAAQEVAPAGMEISIFDIGDLPLYNRDVEVVGDPAPVSALKTVGARSGRSDLRDAGVQLGHLRGAQECHRLGLP